MNTTNSNTTYHGGHGHKHPKVTELVNEEISKLAPFAGLILTISLIIYFLVRFYIFEGFLLKRVYGDTYTKLNDNQRRGFVNHHVAAFAKIIMLAWAGYPFFAIIAGAGSVHSPFAGSRVVTLGDVLLVLNQVFVAMYLFELIYRAHLSYVAVAHHIGSCVIASAAVAISLNWEHQHDATIEFMLCLVWGLFDVVAEFWPHVAIILYRKHPNDHEYLRKVFFSAACVTLSGTIIETAVVMWLWGSLWDRWTLPFRVVTPILHVIFSAAQLWGAKNFFKMWKEQKKLSQADEKTDIEHAYVIETKSS